MEMFKVALVTGLMITRSCVSEERIVQNKVPEIIKSDHLNNEKSFHLQLPPKSTISNLPTEYNFKPEQSNDSDISPNEEDLKKYIDEIFGNSSLKSASSSTTAVTLETTTQAQEFPANTNNASMDSSMISNAFRIGEKPQEGQSKKKDFKFIIIDWDKEIDDSITDSYQRSLAYKPQFGSTDYGDEDESEETESTTEKGSIIIPYPFDEVDPPIDINDPTLQIRNRNTTPRDLDETTTEKGESDDDDLPRSCYYGGPKFPYPEPTIDRTGRRLADIKCEEQMWQIKYRIHDAKIHKDICLKDMAESSVFGGTKSEIGAFPHMGAIGWFTATKRPLFFCGTSLITPMYSITAAHCRFLPNRGDHGVEDPNPKIVRFGIVDLYDVTSVQRNIKEILTPKEFTPPIKYNDIALIWFNEKIEFSKYIQPACLWHTSMDELKIANVTGWGQTESASSSSTMKYAEVDLFGDSMCNEILAGRTNRKWEKGLIHSQFCAGKIAGGVDTCQVIDVFFLIIVAEINKERTKDDQRKVYRKWEEINQSVTNEPLPDTTAMTNFWRSIWSVPVEHTESDWIDVVERECESIEPMKPISINPEDVSCAVRTSHNWNSPGSDGLHNFWIKWFRSLHKCLAMQFQYALESGSLLIFLTTGTTFLLYKSGSTTDAKNYRPITCLPTLYKLLTSILRAEINKHINANNIISASQNGCTVGSRGTKELLLIDMTICQHIRRSKGALSATWIDYKKAYDSVPHSWLRRILELYKIDFKILFGYMYETVDHSPSSARP
ncbi:hypothetical protein evm_011730 [Chilo suppressalis]|nr:hypothetical protein evm_011730 [Chilo suppressalis]